MTWKIGDKVTTKTGASKGEPGRIIDVKKNNSEISEVLVAWDSGGATWQLVSNLERVE